MTREADDGVEAAKRAAREHARAARSALDRMTRARDARAACERALALREIVEARLVLVYAATDDELDVSHLARVLRMRAVSVAYPRVEAPGKLSLHTLRTESSLIYGMFGILEPPADAPRVEVETVDVIIVPGVAFDEACWRLGYGGGYYDRLLPMLRDSCVRIGIGYDEQVLPALPAAEHDVRLDMVVTPTRVICES